MKKVLSAVALLAPVAAFAQTAASGASSVVTGAMTSAGTDVATYGAGLVGLTVIGVGFMVGIKYIKKIRGAA